MANKRNAKKDTGRMDGRFMAIPHVVTDSAAYIALSHPARGLLFEFARQFSLSNNGRLLSSIAYLKPRGWNSADVITRARNELIEAGFIHQTVMGHRPNKASWFAITWQRLDRHPGFDTGAFETFRKGAFMDKNAPLRPGGGIGRAPIAPGGGIGKPRAIPGGGAMGPVLPPSPIPGGGNHLEIPSLGLAEPAPIERKAKPPINTDPTATAAQTLAELWKRMGGRIVPMNMLTAPQAPPGNDWKSLARAATQAAQARQAARKPTPKPPPLLVAREDGRMVDRSDAQDLPAWGC
jgi:hypothetical protein